MLKNVNTVKSVFIFSLFIRKVMFIYEVNFPVYMNRLITTGQQKTFLSLLL